VRKKVVRKVVLRAHKFYEYNYNKGVIRLKNRKCPRCGSIMAHHMKPVERWHCGRCNYTEFITKK